MDRIVATIKPGDSGPQVANLQDTLRILVNRGVIRVPEVQKQRAARALEQLTAQLSEERSRLRYGEATQAFVSLLQAQHAGEDEPTGIVDEKTADVLNRLMGERAAEPPTGTEGLVVKGRVALANREPASGLVVRAYDRDIRRFEQVGRDAVTDADGNYEIQYSRKEFVRADQKSNADLVIRVFPPNVPCDAKTMLAESETHYNAPAAAEVSLQATKRVGDRSEFERYVEAIAPRLVGQAPDGGDLPVAALTDDDIEFLTNDTGIERQHIEWLIEARKAEIPGEVATSSVPKIEKRAPMRAPPSVDVSTAEFYGWFRLGMPTDSNALWKKPADELIGTLRSAINQHIIPSISAEELERIKLRITQAGLDYILQSAAPSSNMALGDLLATLPAPPDPKQQRALAAAAKELRPDDPQLADKIAAVAGFDGDAAAVARTLRLGTLTGGHLPLAKALQERLVPTEGDQGSLSSLATIRPDEWIDLAYEHGTPDRISIGPAEFANALAAQIERQHPTAVLAAQLTEGRPLAQHPLLADADKFLRNNPSFDFVTANLNSMKEETKLAGIADPDKLGRGLLALQRFNSLGASLSDSAALMEHELYSPQQLLAAGPAQLAQMLDGQLPSARIQALHDQAEDLHNITHAAMTAALSPLSGPDVLPGSRTAVVGGDPAGPDEPAGPIGLKNLPALLRANNTNYDPNQYKSLRSVDVDNNARIRDKFEFNDFVIHQPTLQSLFGSQDACACGHCSSVLSPAAYFVDLLQFLKNAAEYQYLLNVLLNHRPDLLDIELSCNNTNTEVPAIDLALEILENAVALPLPISLPPGARIEDELQDKKPVGATVKTALERTVRHFAGEGIALRGQTYKDGTTNWTVIDLHRRWTLSARPENALTTFSVAQGPQVLDTTGISIPALIKGLDNKKVIADSEAAFASLFAPNRNADFSNYHVTVTPVAAGSSWLVSYQFVAELVIDEQRGQLTLGNPGGRPWSENRYKKETLAGALKQLADNKIPELVRVLMASRLSDTAKLRVKAADSRRAKAWTIVSDQRTLNVSFKAAFLKIASLAYQSGDPSADAIAEPENHNPEAYVRLKGANFPWSLPLDLPLEEVRLILERARSTRRQLMELLLPVDTTDSGGLAIELLGSSDAEATLIGDEVAAPTVYHYWGIPETESVVFDAASGSFLRDAPLVLLKNVSILLQQSRLRFEELQALIATRFVTQGGTAPLNLWPRTTCKPGEMSLVELTPGHLDRLHRFIRLWRRLGWTVHELDLAIAAFGGVITSQTLASLARLKRLRQELALPVTSLVASVDRMETLSWTDYLTEGAPEQDSLYVTIFQREAVRKAGDFGDFALRANGLELQNTPTSGISAHADYVANCIGIKSSVLTGWVVAGNSLGVVDILDLANLSRLTAAAYLCRALALDPEKLADHLQLFGPATSPFQTGVTTQERLDAMLEFVERFHNIAKAGMDVETLRYVLQHYDIPWSDANLSATQLTQLAITVRESVRSVPDVQAETSASAADIAAALAATVLAREDAAIAALATGMGDSSELVDELLRKRLRHPSDGTKRGIDAVLASEFTTAEVLHAPTAPIPPQLTVDPALKAKVDAADKAVNELIVRLHKSLLLCAALKFKKTDLDLLCEAALGPNGFTALDFNLLPLAFTASSANTLGFEQLLAVAQIRSLVPRGGDLLHHYILPDDPAVAWSVDGARQVLATGLGLELDEVKSAADQIGLTDDQYRDPIPFSQLVNLLVALKKLGGTVKLAIDLTAPSPDEAAATAARELLSSKYGESQWHDLIKPIEDKLRERQRDALVDYIIDHKNLRSADDLYEQYLIDVQTSSCMKTTRLLQATAAVQLFVQRVLLNIEPSTSLSADKRDLWDWMRSYRVWEANRKVFLFPENWLLPELRDDKTAIFREMESALSEGEPTPDSMRAGLLGYLEELGDAGQIRTISMYQDRRVVGLDAQRHEIVKRTLHVIGRTPNSPYRYYWRTCVDIGTAQMSWGGWEALELDNANDFIMPFLFGGELHVAWPILHKTKEEKTEDHDTAKLQWEVQLAWTRRTNKGWVKRKVGGAQLGNIERLANKDEASSFAFRFSKKELPISGSESLRREEVTIDCYSGHEVNELIPFIPDPAAKAEQSSPKPDSTPDRYHGPDAQWNVKCVIEGHVYRYVDMGEDKGGIFCLPIEGATVSLVDALRQNSTGEGHDVEAVPASDNTKGDGSFRIEIPTQNTGRNGHEGLGNGWSLRVHIEVPGFNSFDRPGTLADTTDPTHPAYAFAWTWRIDYGVEDPTLAKHFNEHRSVKLSKAGYFNFETGKDLRAKLTDDNLAYASDLDALAALNQSLPPQTRMWMLPTAAVRAARVEGSADSEILYLTLSDNTFYYVQFDYPIWKRWADGQPFAPTYRISAATTGLALFQTENQRHLHLDPGANTFDRQNVYANYNWELFLHAPLAIADFLAGQQRFEDARRWLHAVFDPTTDEVLNGIPQYWRFLPFSNDSQPDAIAKLLAWLADPKSGDPNVESALSFQIEQWQQNPFMPHLIARLRPSAYQWYTFFAYLTVLIRWGDQLFRRDTRESVNEATLLYVLAAKLLGPRPRTIPAPAAPPPQTYRSLGAGFLDAFSNEWITYADLEGVRKILASRRANGSATSQSSESTAHIDKQVGFQTNQTTGIQLLNTLSTLAFCIPQNEKLTEFYDLIEKRLFDVRHCRNIDGVFRELPLYDPPIDPLLLIRARAAGLDIASVIAELYAPLPNYRFTFTLQKALELCVEVKSLGGALLAALEKQDAEELTLLRSTHEIAMLKLARDVRKKQVDEADANIVALQQSQATTTERFRQYQKLLGKNSITKGQDGLPVVEQSSSLSVSTDPIGAASGLGLSRMEVEQLRYSAMAHLQTQVAGAVQVVAGVISLFPNIFAGTPFAGQTSGGTNFGIGANAIAKSIEMIAAEANYLASQASTFGGYERRQDEWVHQSKLALAELKQLDKQILAAQIRRNIAQNELDNHDQQIANANEVDDFMRSKFTSQQLFRWMSAQISEVYFRTYQLALDQGRRAERTYRYELGLDEATTPYVQSDNWDSLKRGLLAGEHLHHDLKRMESAFLERNIREYELTKHVSLLQLDPIALITLRETGACDFEIPEALFDLDCPGHYLRRIKTVSLSIPCVTGPYASVSATLRLQRNRIRVDSSGDSYEPVPNDVDDPRFSTNRSPTIAIVTSSSQQDSGMFEPNLRDERYLPFEGAGVISRWQMELPGQFRQFDYDTIGDVVLHIRYTAREEIDLRTKAEGYLGEKIDAAEAAGMVRLFSVRHEFPSAWAKFIATEIDGTNIKTAQLSLDLRAEHYPFWSQGRLKSIKEATVIARVSDDLDEIKIAEKADGTGDSDTLGPPADAGLAGLLMGALTNLAPTSPVTEPGKPLKLFFKQNSVTDLWIAIAWKAT